MITMSCMKQLQWLNTNKDAGLYQNIVINIYDWPNYFPTKFYILNKIVQTINYQNRRNYLLQFV